MYDDVGNGEEDEVYDGDGDDGVSVMRMMMVVLALLVRQQRD